MQRFDQRQSFLVSAAVHLVVISLLGSLVGTARAPALPTEEPTPRERQARVFLPRELLRELQAQRKPQPPPPPPPPPSPAPGGKDRMSIGAPSELRQKGPLILRPEDDLTKVAKGVQQPLPEPPQPTLVPTPPPPGTVAREDTGDSERAGRPGLVLPPGVGSTARGSEAGQRPAGPSNPSIASSLKNLRSRIGEQGSLGLPTGTGTQMGPLFFDPEGADFTLWINHFKNEVYRNWIVPQPALMGFSGHVDIAFVVERDGSLSNVRILKSSGTTALDRAAQNALVGSRFLPLPDDFAPPRVTMQATFYYNEAPRGS